MKGKAEEKSVSGGGPALTEGLPDRWWEALKEHEVSAEPSERSRSRERHHVAEMDEASHAILREHHPRALAALPHLLGCDMSPQEIGELALRGGALPIVAAVIEGAAAHLKRKGAGQP